jgi:hypothetical protein
MKFLITTGSFAESLHECGGIVCVMSVSGWLAVSRSRSVSACVSLFLPLPLSFSLNEDKLLQGTKVPLAIFPRAS